MFFTAADVGLEIVVEDSNEQGSGVEVANQLDLLGRGDVVGQDGATWSGAG